MTPPRNSQAPRRPSLHDVAKMAGVSAAAVSYVVNGRTGEVGPETRQRIAGAIKTLKYQPQRRGLSLKFNREYAIGLVVLNADPSFLADPFTTQVATGLSNALAEPGFGLTVTGCRTLKGLETLLQRPIGVDAYVAMASGSAAMRARSYRMLSDLNLPVIVVQEGVPRGIGDACAVLQDDFGGAQALTRQLAATGARRFLWVVPSRSWPAIERREKGIRSALPPEAVLLKVACDERDFGATIAAIERALDRSALPDAIMGANDQIAIAALKVLARRGIQVPQGIQVTGYNDFHFRNYASPLLTTITSPAEAIGLRGAQAILSRLDAGAFPTRNIELPVRLNLGDTTLPAGEARRRA